MQEALAAAEAALAQLPRQEKAAAAERVEQERHLLQLVQQRAQHSAGHKAAAHAAALEEQLAAAAAHEGEARAAQQALLDKAAVRRIDVWERRPERRNAAFTPWALRCVKAVRRHAGAQAHNPGL